MFYVEIIIEVMMQCYKEIETHNTRIWIRFHIKISHKEKEKEEKNTHGSTDVNLKYSRSNLCIQKLN